MYQVTRLPKVTLAGGWVAAAWQPQRTDLSRSSCAASATFDIIFVCLFSCFRTHFPVHSNNARLISIFF